MSQITDRPPGTTRGIALFVTLVLFGGSLTVLYFAMRAVMDVGGFCAAGGPYEISTPCPEGTVAPLVIAPPLMVISLLAYIGLSRSTAGAVTLWATIFGALGWNFVDKGLIAPRVAGEAMIWGWMLPGAVFWVMALVPLYFVFQGGLRAFGEYRQAGDGVRSERRSRFLWLVLVHLAGMALGIWGSVRIFF